MTVCPNPSEVVIRPLDAFFAVAARDPRAMNAAITVARHLPSVREWEVTPHIAFELRGKLGTFEISIYPTYNDEIRLMVFQRQPHKTPNGWKFRPDLCVISDRTFAIEPFACWHDKSVLTLDERVAMWLQYWREDCADRYRDSLALFGGWRG